MSETYMELFDIKEVFEQNSRQRILMGTPKNESGDVVVINRFYRDDLFDESLYPLLKRSLKNLVHIENTIAELIVITAYPEGAPLTSLVESQRLLPKDRLKLAELYLDQTAAYEGLPPALQFLLIDLNQFVVQDTGLEPKELMLLDRNFNPGLESSAVTQKLSTALDIILKPDMTAYDEFEKDSIRQLIAGLAVGGVATLTAARGTFAGLVASSERMAGIRPPHSRSPHVSDQSSPATVSESPSGGAALGSAAIGAAALGAGAAYGSAAYGSAAYGSAAYGSAAMGADTGAANSAGAALPPGSAAGINSRTIELDNLFVSEEPATRSPAAPKRKPVKKRQYKWIAWVLLIAVAALVLFGIFNIISGLFTKKAPVARFETQKDNSAYHFINKSTFSGSDNKLTQISWRIEIDGTELLTSDEFDLTVSFKNAGKYKITLMVKDRYRWSSAYSQIVDYTASDAASFSPSTETGTEGLNGSDDPLSGITATDVSDNIQYDDKTSRTGTTGLKLDMTSTDQAQLTLDGLSVNKATALSFWMRSSKTDRVVLTVFGYDNNGLRFTKRLTLNPKSTSSWEMVTLQSNYDGIVSMKLQFSAPGSILWLDDFELAAFK